MSDPALGIALARFRQPTLGPVPGFAYYGISGDIMAEQLGSGVYAPALEGLGRIDMIEVDKAEDRIFLAGRDGSGYPAAQIFDFSGNKIYDQGGSPWVHRIAIDKGAKRVYFCDVINSSNSVKERDYSGSQTRSVLRWSTNVQYIAVDYVEDLIFAIDESDVIYKSIMSNNSYTSSADQILTLNNFRRFGVNTTSKRLWYCPDGEASLASVDYAGGDFKDEGVACDSECHVYIDDEGFVYYPLEGSIYRIDPAVMSPLLVTSQTANMQRFTFDKTIELPPPPPPDLARGLILHYTMDNISGSTLVDETGNHDGMISGASQSPGVVGQALEFDGTDDYVELDYYGVGGANPRTFSAWINTSQPGSVGRLFAYGTDSTSAKYHIRINGSNGDVLRVENAGGNHYGTTLLTDGAWHHVVVVFPSGATNINQHRLYVDGLEESYNPASAANSMNTATSTKARLGYASSAQGQDTEKYKGKIDLLRFYDRELSNTEIQLLYDEGAA